MYVMLLLDALHLRCQTFRGSSTTPQSSRDALILFKIHSAVTILMNNQINNCSYYVQLFTIIYEQLRIFVHNVMRFFYNC